MLNIRLEILKVYGNSHTLVRMVGTKVIVYCSLD